MSKRIDKTQLIDRVAQRLSKPPAEIAPVADALLEEIDEALKSDESVSLRNFGTFYIDVRHTGTVFKFDPSPRLRALFGWSFTYKLDEAWGMNETVYSEALAQQMVWLSLLLPYGQCGQVFVRMGEQIVPASSIWRQTQRHGARLAACAEHQRQQVSVEQQLTGAGMRRKSQVAEQMIQLRAVILDDDFDTLSDAA